jgi:hypothetical protein
MISRAARFVKERAFENQPAVVGRNTAGEVSGAADFFRAPRVC